MKDETKNILKRITNELYEKSEHDKLLDTLKKCIKSEIKIDSVIEHIRHNEMFLQKEGNQETVCKWIKAVWNKDTKTEKTLIKLINIDTMDRIKYRCDKLGVEFLDKDDPIYSEPPTMSFFNKPKK